MMRPCSKSGIMRLIRSSFPLVPPRRPEIVLSYPLMSRICIAWSSLGSSLWHPLAQCCFTASALWQRALAARANSATDNNPSLSCPRSSIRARNPSSPSCLTASCSSVLSFARIAAAISAMGMQLLAKCFRSKSIETGPHANCGIGNGITLLARWLGRAGSEASAMGLSWSRLRPAVDYFCSRRLRHYDGRNRYCKRKKLFRLVIARRALQACCSLGPSSACDRQWSRFARQFEGTAPLPRTETTSSPSSAGQTPISSGLRSGNMSWAKLTSIASETPSSSFSVKTPVLARLFRAFFQISTNGHVSPPAATLAQIQAPGECRFHTLAKSHGQRGGYIPYL